MPDEPIAWVVWAPHMTRAFVAPTAAEAKRAAVDWIERNWDERPRWRTLVRQKYRCDPIYDKARDD